MKQQTAHETKNLRRSVKDRFLLINREKQRRIHESLSNRHCEILDILPLLFHVNHALLPGYVASKTPHGIPEYSPGKAAEVAARKLTKSFSLKKRALPVYDIQGLYMMGSTGTIAHSEDSDFDIWVCHRKGLSDEGLNELQQKATLIEQWADDHDLEVHFFIFNADDFRGGKQSQLSSESSGSTQHYLLLDEFYRSGIVMCGLFPIWWLVPCEHEADYESYIESLVERREVIENDFIDFGCLAVIPPEEFFGATLWQLYKSINSPYKSVIKLLLMEVYANEYPDIDLLSLRYKRQVHEGINDLNKIDPYLMMYHKVEEYLMSANDSIRLDLLRRSFYLKVNAKLSRPRKQTNDAWRHETMEFMVHSWDWGEGRILTLDMQQDWKLQTVLEERRTLISALTQGYRMLSQFARKQSEIARISQTDLNVLGRKLYGAFERKAGKVELVNRGIAPSLHESSLSLHRIITDNQESWLLFRDNISIEKATESTPLKRGQSLIELLTWCHFNNLLNTQSRVVMHGCGELTNQELRHILKTLEHQFPCGYVSGAKTEELINTARLRKACLFINTGIEPHLRISKNGEHIASDRTNAFSYGAMHENLLISFDLVLTTTWEEVYTFRYMHIDGLLDCISEYLRWSPCSSGQPPAPVHINCFSSSYGNIISATVSSILKEVIQCFYRAAETLQPRFFLEVEKKYFMLEVIDDTPTYQHLNTLQEVLNNLGETSTQASTAIFEKNSCLNTLLPDIYTHNKNNSIELFFHSSRDTVDVFLLDEKGALFQQRLPLYDCRVLLQQFTHFLIAIRNRKEHLPHASEGGSSASPINAFLVKTSPGKRKPLFSRISLSDEEIIKPYLDIQVIVQIDRNDRKTFTIYCDNQEFSSLEHGNLLYDVVAGFILSNRKSGEAYPIYITDIDLPETLIRQENQLQTINFLKYKKNIEARLNLALQDVHNNMK